MRSMKSSKELLQGAKDIFIPVAPAVFSNRSTVEVTDGAENSQGILNREEKKGDEKSILNTEENIGTDGLSSVDSETFEKGHVHRKLLNRHIQLIGIGGTIGVALFVSIGTALTKGGPLGLLLGFTFWCLPILALTATCAEMVCYIPIPSPFIAMADRVVDESFGVMTGWNFWVLQCSLIPFELTLFNNLIHFWVTGYSPAIPIAIQIVCYFCINVFAVELYGESEFWLALGKVMLAVGLLLFTFFTMVGANPERDVYGFRYWRDPGPFAEFYSTGSLGKFQGFLACVIQAVFTIAGPEYVSMVAGEAVNPRKTLPKAYKQVAYRLTLFFVGGALCVGIVVASNDPTLLDAINSSKAGAGSSPYVVAMINLKIKVLPHIVNVLLLTSSFSAGNSYTFCSSRTLYGLALNRKAPKWFSYCNKNGVPIYAVLMSNAWALLAFLQLGEKASTVLDWIVNLVSASQLMNFWCISVTYLFFFRACKAQGVDRTQFTFVSWCQPYLAIVASIFIFCFLWIQGYAVFLKGNWSIDTFLFNYLIIFVDIFIFICWKLLKRSKLIAPEDADITTGLAEIHEHERIYYSQLEEREKNMTFFDKVSDILFGN